MKAIDPSVLSEHNIVYSFFGIPEQDAPTLLPAKAKALGCDPKKGHFKALKDGKSVTLDDGTVVTSE